MKRRNTIILLILTLALVQLACNMPVAGPTRLGTATPTGLATLPEGGGATATFPPIITATPNPAATQAGGAPTAATGQGDGGCTNKAAFVSDVTVPDDTIIPAGNTFAKTWRVRNDGTCTWGPNGYALHSLVYTGGSRLGAPNVIPLSVDVQPGQTVDITVNMTAPTASGTYISQWEFLVDNPSAGTGTYVGVGPGGAGPLYARIKVGSGSQTSLIRLNFDPGATATSVSGDLNPNEVRSYVLGAQKDQILMAMLSPSANGAKLKITASDKTALQGSTTSDGQSAMVSLPSNQDYIVTITNGSQKVNFSLSITIPSRITFQPGAVSASVDGQVSHHFQVTYVLRALAGQTMTVALTGNDVGLTIYGLEDGQPLVRAVGGATSFNGKLPATQDYVLIVVPAVDSTTFNLKVTVK